jgi:cyanophycinase-like exopeptidase
VSSVITAVIEGVAQALVTELARVASAPADSTVQVVGIEIDTETVTAIEPFGSARVIAPATVLVVEHEVAAHSRATLVFRPERAWTVESADAAVRVCLPVHALTLTAILQLGTRRA